LKRFEGDWATGEILRQFINGKRKGLIAKEDYKEKSVGKKRKRSNADSDADAA
jgi:hypothetical protein